ncbi:hypothetical protein FLA4_02390 [Candidatus Rickettsia kotlanii]|nr:hypothetical protein FLA4_02390 [Candidatus Rickettsia kotlanii]BDU61071.1 hypothetical protein HM2_02390 [Candidatus Rickettsia kotlanii]
MKTLECYFWSFHNGAEIDLLIFKNGRRLGFKIKYTNTPGITKSMQISLEDLKLDQINVIFPGEISFKLSEKIQAIGLSSLI